MKKITKALGIALAVSLLFATGCTQDPNDSTKNVNNNTTQQEEESGSDKNNSGSQKEDDSTGTDNAKDDDDSGSTDDSKTNGTKDSAGTGSGSDDDSTESESDEKSEEDDTSQTTQEESDKEEEQKANTEISTEVSSVDFAKKLVIGWNLGNTLDAPTETDWGMPKTTKAMIDAVKAAGFKTIRIPVSWSKHVISDGEYTIDSSWMSRVKEIVDWAIADDLYVILNVHHDNYSTSDLSSNAGFALSTSDSSIQTKSKAYLKAVWTQIAGKFNNGYDEKLIFEVLNEPRAVGENYEWYMPDSATAKKYCDVITDYENTCIAAIRATGGNNAERFIMVPGYAASGSDQRMLGAYTMPTDTAEDKLILSTHAYSPYNFAMANSDAEFGSDDEASLTRIFNYLKTTYTDKGIGVVMGEASASNKNNTDERIKWAKDYFAKAKAAGIPVILWDNMVYTADGNEDTSEYPTGYSGEHHGWLNRNACKWYFPTIIKAMMDTVGVTGCLVPEYVIPTVSNIGWDEASATTIATTSATLSWGTDYKLNKSYFENAAEGSILKITFKASGASIKIINSSWTTYSDGTIINGSADSDGVITASSIDLYYVLTSSDATAWKSQDMYIAGQNGTVTSVKFLASPSTN